MRERILGYIVGHVETMGYPPSIREIAKHLGYSPSSAMQHLDRLEADGYLTRDRKVARSIRVSAR